MAPRIYFVLAAFDVLTVTGSLHLSHRIMSIYAASVDTNQRWADRLGRYSDLGQLAAAVDAPGNDVFDTRDVDAEAARQAQALAVFERALEAARGDLVAGPEAEAPALLADLDAVAGAMRSMLAEADQKFGISAVVRRGWPARGWRPWTASTPGSGRSWPRWAGGCATSRGATFRSRSKPRST